MSTKIQIQSTVIDFPTSGESPNWAPAMLQFALAVENALNASIGPYDVAPQIQTVDTNGVTDLDITNLAFPSTDVSQVVIDYSVLRTITEGETDKIYTEGGKLNCTYRPENNRWELTQTKTGDAKSTFSMSLLGQVSVSFDVLPGTGATHRGHVSFRAVSLLSHD